MSNEENLVIFAGGLFRDLVACAPRFPNPGETIIGEKFHMGFGGKSSNQAVMCRKLGGNVFMVGKVGGDAHGRAYTEELIRLGVDVSYLGISETATTGIATIFVDTSTGENQIVIVRGANDDVNEGFIHRADPIFQKAKLLVCALEMNEDAIIASMELAKKHRVTTLLNAAPGKADLNPKLLELTDILCVNETEAELISGLKVKTVAQAEKAATKLLEMTINTVIITLGENGAIFGTKSHPNPHHVEGISVKSVKDTTGAGDAFVGTFAYFLAERPGLGLQEIIFRACHVAAMSITKDGTQASYPSRSEVPEQILSYRSLIDAVQNKTPM